MADNTQPETSTPDTGPTSLRNGAAILIVILIIGGLLLAYGLSEERPELNHPARIAVTDAALILSETYPDEKKMENSLRAVHEQLEKAISLLDQAEDLDPSDRRQIETLRVRLKALEDPTLPANQDPKTLKHSYHALVEQMNTLAAKLTKPAK